MPPAPAQVPYNDWRRLPVAALAAFVPTEAVSVVIPCYQVPAATLAKTLASLEGQRFPRHLLEVVLVDDGSEPPLQPPPSPLDVKVVRQERCGYGTWRARNNGVDAAAHDIVLFLDADELAQETWISAHARWHHAAADILTAGPRWHVATEGVDVEAIRRGNLRSLLADLPTDPPWTLDYFARPDEQLAKADDLFHVVSGGNFGMRKAFYREVGGNAPFRHWRFEDTELAFRAYAYGGLMVPVREALVWHQGRWAEGRKEKHRAVLILEGRMAHLIPHPRCRPLKPGRTYRVPRHVVALDAGECVAPESVVALVERLLADRIHDLAVRVELGPAQSRSEFAREYLRYHFDDEPRVVVRCVRGCRGRGEGVAVGARRVPHRGVPHPISRHGDLSRPPGGAIGDQARFGSASLVRTADGQQGSRGFDHADLGLAPHASDSRAHRDLWRREDCNAVGARRDGRTQGRGDHAAAQALDRRCSQAPDGAHGTRLGEYVAA